MKAESMIHAFTVMMHPTLVDELDEGFSPMDGLVAIDQMFSELPLLHAGVAPKRLCKRTAPKLKVYRGCYDWYKSLGFSYVQIGTTLHVLELWYDEIPNLGQVDVILGTGRTAGYEPFGNPEVHHHDVVEIENCGQRQAAGACPSGPGTAEAGYGAYWICWRVFFHRRIFLEIDVIVSR
jgi:hypothetical protein